MIILKNRWFAKFARKQGLADITLVEAIRRAEAGLVDANLGGGVIKQRVARQGEGRSGSYRTVVAYRAGARAVFLFGFAKSDRANLTTRELESFRQLGMAIMKAFTGEIEHAVTTGVLQKVKDDENL